MSEPKHVGKSKKTVTSSIGEGLQEVLMQKVANDQERLKTRQQEMQDRLKIEHERLDLEREREENRVRLEFVKVAESGSQVLEEDTKAEINDWVKALFAKPKAV